MARGRTVEGEAGPNKCDCKPVSCKGDEELCSNDKCKICKANCPPKCEGCEKMKCAKGQPCKCCTPICGCKEDCYKEGSKNECKGLGANCKRCQTKCQKGKPCMCYRCNCGTQCNGFLCACCYWCNRGKCMSNGTCDGFVLGKCYEKCDGPEKCSVNDGKEDHNHCKGHGTYNDDGRPVYVDKCTCKPSGVDPDCECHKGRRDPKCRCIRGNRREGDNCLITCDMCGKLCSQDSYIHEGTIVVASLAIAMIIIIVWSKYRDKFRRVFYELSDSFSRASKHSSAYTNNLVGDKIPGEGNTDRYPAFRPMLYAGLA